MKPLLYQKALKLIEQGQIKSITVDIFDTILLNTYWPESLRNYHLAQIWLAQLHAHISPEITDYEIYDWYRFAKQLLEESDQPLRFDLYIETMVSLLCHKYNVQLTNDQQLELLITLISNELQFIINHTKINHHLIAQLSAIKQLAPKIKIYCASHTHLTSDQLKTICQISNITIFDGGTSTADLDQTNPTFADLLTELSKDLSAPYNLHISASRAECDSAVSNGSQAYHYHPVRLRGLRTLAGQATQFTINQAARFREVSHYRQDLKYITNEPAHVAAQTAALWHAQIATQLELCSKSSFLLPAEDPTLATQDNLIQAPDLDQDTIFRAFVWLLANHESSRWDAANLLKLLAKSAKITDRLALYRLCYDDSYTTSEFIINSREESTFWNSFLNEIRNNDAASIELLRQSYITVAQYLPRDDKKLYYINLSRDDSAWIFREFARLHNINNQIIDWRPSSISKNLTTDILNTDTNGGLAQTELAPDYYSQYILRSYFKKSSKLN